MAACAELAPQADDVPPLGPPLAGFGANGRISLRQGERSDHLQFDWQHAPGRDVVLFSSPIGQGLAELGRDAGGAWLIVPGESERRAPDLAALAQQLFGAPLPLDVLAEWLRGARPELRGDIDGWRIQVSETAPYRERRLPRRLEARRDDIELRIVVDDWGDND
jgi:outer membrane lipoprotein LolB